MLCASKNAFIEEEQDALWGTIVCFRYYDHFDIIDDTLGHKVYDYFGFRRNDKRKCFEINFFSEHDIYSDSLDSVFLFIAIASHYDLFKRLYEKYSRDKNIQIIDL